MTESQVQAEVHRALNSRSDTRVFRNHCGRVQGKDGQWHTFGLMKGSADLIGWCRGRFLSVEVKTATGRVSPEQENWMNQVNKHGGIAFIARSAEQAVRELDSRL